MFRRIAIVHDWLIAMRGGERVLESLCTLYPSADLFTLRYDASLVSPMLARHQVTTSFIDRLARLPPLRGRFRGLLPLFPLAAESFRLDDYDLVISSSHCVAAGVLTAPHALHVAYLHSPMRYVWEAQSAYEERFGGGAVGKWAFRALAHYLRLWDTAASARPDVMLANSSYTRQRIRKYYGRDAEVIEPPIDTAKFGNSAQFESGGQAPAGAGQRPAMVGDRGWDPEAPLLLVSALVPYKRVDLAISALANRREQLIVVGEGPERAALQRLAGPNVSFRGWVDDTTLVDLYRRCRALLHPALDDFGMVMVEAMAAGKPVIASRDGGAAEIVRNGETGLFFDEPTVESIRGALDRLSQSGGNFSAARLRETARRFDRTSFERRFRAAVERAAQVDPRTRHHHAAGITPRAGIGVA